mmetsp:Transcript_113052/g.319896  ORF Transcript_113052/g.319896 Transcript_113052/m.319896 type:complete len:204 (-) Transcript_113052:57-668(-)
MAKLIRMMVVYVAHTIYLASSYRPLVGSRIASPTPPCNVHLYPTSSWVPKCKDCPWWKTWISNLQATLDSETVSLSGIICSKKPFFGSRKETSCSDLNRGRNEFIKAYLDQHHKGVYEDMEKGQKEVLKRSTELTDMTLNPPQDRSQLEAKRKEYEVLVDAYCPKAKAVHQVCKGIYANVVVVNRMAYAAQWPCPDCSPRKCC